MQLKFLFNYSIKISKPINIGASRHGVRDIFQLEEGRLWGEGINGKVLPVGGEFQLTDKDGNYHVDVRAVFETDDDARIYTHYTGVSVLDEKALTVLRAQGHTDYSDAYFVTTPRFETGHEKYRWLNNAVCIAEGRVAKAWTVEYRVYQCLSSNELP